jgi:hypothetical protein
MKKNNIQKEIMIYLLEFMKFQAVLKRCYENGIFIVQSVKEESFVTAALLSGVPGFR